MELITTEDLAATASEVLKNLLGSALAERDRASIALSGGSTPWAALDRLAEANLDWSRVDVYQVDERVAPNGHPDRNLTHVESGFLSLVSAVVHPMPVNDGDLEAAARGYQDGLPGNFDIVHLGLGPDGHTASLVPGDPVLDVDDRDVAMSQEYQGRRRMTLAYRAIANARSIVWLVTGESKRRMLGRLLESDPCIPAGRVSARQAIVVTDLPLVDGRSGQ